MNPIQLIYLANILVAGWVGVHSLFFTRHAAVYLYQGVYPASDAIKITGALWLAIALLSLFGLWLPERFAAVLLLQLIYKGGWLLFVALPGLIEKESFPVGIASFFLVWVLILPFVIPWDKLFTTI
ncbi:MAG: hypothetical protein GC180_10370 [Bacteroidetes bacterium]|nr:hypothetical protein [Bacteroidota bacterium]